MSSLDSLTRKVAESGLYKASVKERSKWLHIYE